MAAPFFPPPPPRPPPLALFHIVVFFAFSPSLRCLLFVFFSLHTRLNLADELVERVDPELEVRQQGSVYAELVPLVLNQRLVRRGVVALETFDEAAEEVGISQVRLRPAGGQQWEPGDIIQQVHRGVRFLRVVHAVESIERRTETYLLAELLETVVKCMLLCRGTLTLSVGRLA